MLSLRFVKSVSTAGERATFIIEVFIPTQPQQWDSL